MENLDRKRHLFIYMRAGLRPVLCIAFFMLVSAAGILAQEQVSGTVRNADGDPLAGVAVVIEGSHSGVSTNQEGVFSIPADPGQTLLFYFLGYKNQAVKIGSRSNLEITLESDTKMLDEVVVVGYGVQRRRDIVGAIETLSGKVLEERKTSNVSRSLQGQIPGLTLTFSDGKPSRNAEIQIRGASNSIGAGGSALVLVDGLEMDMNTVSADDIESITVLKDASSTAVYGARGAFGVILITTKNPLKNTTRVVYDGSFSIFKRTVDPRNVTNGLQWTDAFIESYQGRYNRMPTAINNAMNPYSSSWYEELVRRDADPSYEKWRVNNNGLYEYFGNYDWDDIIYKNFTTGHQHSLSISGGGEKADFMISGKFFKQNGIYNYGKEDYRQYNVRAKGRVQFTRWMNVENNTSFMRRKIYQPRVSEGNQLIQRQVEIVGSPLIGPTNADGTWTHAATYIGIAGFDEGTTWQKDGKFDIHQQNAFNVDFIKNVLVGRAEIGYFYNHTDRQRVRNIYEYYEGPSRTGTQPATSQYTEWYYTRDRLNGSATLTYTPIMKDEHSLTVLGGWNIEDYKYLATSFYREGVLVPDKPNFSMMDGANYAMSDVGSVGSSLVGLFYRASYSYKSRYLLEASGRYDGNSRFPKNQRWGFFPSASAGWRISEERFMENSSHWLDNLKLRFSAGSSGNGLISDAYAYMSLMGISKSTFLSGGNVVNYTTAPSPVPEGLTWEKVTTYDLGLDFEVLGGKLNFVFDVFRKKTTGMYVPGQELPAVFGNAAPKGNYADMKTDGWEVSLGWRDSFRAGGKPFHYSFRAMAWDNVTKVTKYTSTTGTLPTLYKTNYYEGMTIGEIWGYTCLGLFESDEEAANWADQSRFAYHVEGIFKKGDLKFADLDESNIVDNGSNTINDHGDLRVIGNASPRYSYSLTASGNWNGIGLTMMWQGVGKRDWYPAKDSGYFWGMYGRSYGYYLPWQMEDNRYTDDNGNTNAYWPRLRGYMAEHGDGHLATPNTRYIQNARYIRLKNLTVDYTFPKKICDKLMINTLRVYFSGENLLTFTPLKKWAKNYDPEGISAGDADFASTVGTNGDGYGYPMMKSFTFGINISF